MATVDLDSTDIMQLMIDGLTDGGLSDMISEATTSDLSQESWDKLGELILTLDSANTENSYALKAREHLAQAAEQISKLIASTEIKEEEVGS